ncbi:MAG TPA: YggT family protein [Blastocatellia bacterium]
MVNEDSQINSALMDEERRHAAHQQVKAQIDNDVNARIQRESARTQPAVQDDLADVAQELKQKSVHQAVRTEREVERSKVAARISQVIDYLFYIAYGLIALQFMLRLMGARYGTGFVQFIDALTRPILGPFEHIVATPTYGRYEVQLSYLVALVVYILLHLGINGALRLVAYRKVTV